jgi:hypothetical protein
LHAEFYIESLLEDKIYRLSIRQVIELLAGSIELLNIKEKETINEFIEWNETDHISLLNSFNYDKGLEKATCLLLSSK